MSFCAFNLLGAIAEDVSGPSYCNGCVWLGGVMVSASDLRSRARGFDFGVVTLTVGTSASRYGLSVCPSTRLADSRTPWME